MVTRKLVWGILMMLLTISCTASEQEEAPDNTASRAPRPVDVLARGLKAGLAQTGAGAATP